MIETDAGNVPFEVDDLDVDTLLALLPDAEKQDRAAARRKLRLALQWCALHPGTPEDHLVDGDGYGPGDPASDCDLPIGGEGTPLVASGAAEEFAAALAVATITGLNMLADALDLAFRLKQIWARVEALEVPVWKARRVAQLTHPLSQVAAAWVDNELAPILDKVGMPTIEKIVNRAIAAFCPELLKDGEKAGKAAWGVHLDHGVRVTTGAWAGTSSIDALGDTQDLIAFHNRVCAIAEQLRQAGDDDTLDQRKAKALGIIGRGEDRLADAGPAAETGDPVAGDPAVPSGPTSKPDRRGPGAPTKVYLQITSADLAEHAMRGTTNTGPTPWGTVERLGQATLDLLAEWAGHDHFTVTPVLDMNRTDAVDRHDPPLWMRELIILRDKKCVFPYCATDARSCDLDHIEPYRPDGPPGQTSPDKLAPLCRCHHNMKTHGRWRYQRNRDGTYTWTSPRGLTYLVTDTGTVRLD